MVGSYLTERQKQILDYIQEFRQAQGLSPTHREICEHFGYRSYGTVHKHLKLLQQKGYLRRDWNQKRGLEILRPVSTGKTTTEQDLPFFGLIAAGKPIEAVPGDERLAVPRHLLSAAGEHFVLRVVGDSMVNEGIHDGDLVIVLRRERARPGEMVVALVENEATLKRFYPEGESIRLQPANPSIPAFRVPADQVKVQGVVVGLMRKF